MSRADRERSSRATMRESSPGGIAAIASGVIVSVASIASASIISRTIADGSLGGASDARSSSRSTRMSSFSIFAVCSKRRFR